MRFCMVTTFYPPYHFGGDAVFVQALARAPIVALAEDHAFPAPGWAEALIAAHRDPWAAIGAVIRHPNDPKNIIA
jgi:hypothetical protein